MGPDGMIEMGLEMGLFGFTWVRRVEGRVSDRTLLDYELLSKIMRERMT